MSWGCVYTVPFSSCILDLLKQGRIPTRSTTHEELEHLPSLSHVIRASLSPSHYRLIQPLTTVGFYLTINNPGVSSSSQPSTQDCCRRGTRLA